MATKVSYARLSLRRGPTAPQSADARNFRRPGASQLALLLRTDEIRDSLQNVLFVLTSHNKFLSGKPTGWYL